MPERDSLFDLSGKVALVTGGSRGIGKQVVLAYARHGADVVIASRKGANCETVAKQVAEETGRSALAVACHVGRWNECDALVEAAYDRFGKVDVLVNNAGMSPLYEKLTDVTEELYDKVINVNLRGPFRLSSLIGERMMEGDGGSIINVSSIAAVTPSPIEIPYATAKAGLNNMTISMAKAFAPKVRVNCIMPGPFMTDITDAWSTEMIEGLGRMVPLGRGAQADEAVGAALYFASRASSFTTGAVLKIDGGLASPPA
ncbi:MAG: glucose 1-dehydrogenase [Myxococcales bacterium]|nr:glucose 1-dehydrogenase [Myxococcales bacterium]